MRTNCARWRYQILFQSAPGREAGRCRPARAVQAHAKGFNPRPAVRPGDALCAGVLISAQDMFQSAPGREAGRCSHRTDCGGLAFEFQSAPGREAGRCDDQTVMIAMDDGVSIRARP